MRSGEVAVKVLDRPKVLTPEAAFNKFLDDRETLKGITRTTQATYLWRFKLFGDFLQREEIRDVRRQLTTAVLAKYFGELGNRTDMRVKDGNGKQLSRRTIHSHFISIKALGKFLFHKKDLDEDLFRKEDAGGFRVKKPSRVQKVAPKRDVVEKIITCFDPAKPPAIYTDFTPTRARFVTALVRALVMGMATLGLRSTEVLGLRMDQIDWREQTIRFKAKGDADRFDRMDFNDDVKAVWTDYLNERENITVKSNAEDLFFVTHAGRYLDRDALRWIFNQIKDATGIKLTPHQLRYYAATQLYKKSQDIVLVQRFLRHGQIETTRGYLGIDPEEMREKILTNSPTAGMLKR